MPVIFYSGANLHILNAGHRTKREDGGGVNDLSVIQYTFKPGTNEVPQETWDALLADKSGRAQEMIDAGDLKPMVGQLPSAKGKPSKIGTYNKMDDIDISKMPTSAAIALINGTAEMRHLQRFQKQEENRSGGMRKLVEAQLEVQMKAVKDADEELKAS